MVKDLIDIVLSDSIQDLYRVFCHTALFLNINR